MRIVRKIGGSRFAKILATGLAALLISACGGGTTAEWLVGSAPSDAAATALLEQGNSSAPAKMLMAVPSNADSGAPAGTGPVTPPPLVVHYQRADGNYTGWQLYIWGIGNGPGWGGLDWARKDTFGAVYDAPITKASGTLNFILHNGDNKDNGGADQSYVLAAGTTEIWRKEGNSTTYNYNPDAGSAPPPPPPPAALDIKTVHVHYQRYDNKYADWGLHLWNGGGMDTSRTVGVAINDWNNPVGFDKMPGYAANVGEVVFDIPVINPKDDASRTGLEFIIHSKLNPGDKDGWNSNIVVNYSDLTIAAQVGDIWLMQQDPTVYAVPNSVAYLQQARGIWLTKQLIKWPGVGDVGAIKLYYSSTGQIKAKKNEKVAGFDGFISLDPFYGTVPANAAKRFAWVGAGAVYSVKPEDMQLLYGVHKKQLVLVQEDATTGNIRNATMTQQAGALDDLYSAAAAVTDLGVSVQGGSTVFKLWAPTAQKVSLVLFPSSTGNAVSATDLVFDSATGVWSLTMAGDQSGKYYRFGVQVFVRGVGLVLNMVTDPYSRSLNTDSMRSYIANLDTANLKPTGWDTMTLPTKVAAATDMSIYELHVRDFSANDSTVTAANRGKYLAFTEAGTNGMKHLKALSDAGLTDVHLLPTFDIASVPESGCTTPSISLTFPSDDLGQQNLIAATRDTDCFNWGYDPYHYSAPEGSYASTADDGAKRILEFRQMVKGLNDAGLRVGMDVVYNHTTASGQNTKSVLDRVVPGYYQRQTDAGKVMNGSCCEDTATENMMMGKLMIDSAITWARDYKVSSFRFDVMSYHSRDVMVDLKAKVKAAAGRDVQILGEGWDNALGNRFAQAKQGGLAGDGIGSFGDFMRDAVRGTKFGNDGADMVKNQGYVNGAFYDRNAMGTTDEGTMKWFSDLIKGGLAGSLKDYVLAFNWGQTIPLSEHNSGLGFATQPDEVVNYVENHDNQTLFDNNAMKLPTSTSKADRARVQILGASTVAFAQGIAYYHAGVDTLRSKSLDRNSYNSGDWFNRLDWSYADNNFGVGMPFEANSATQATMLPFLSTAAIKPGAADIAWTRDAFRDLLKIRSSSTLFRMRSAADIKSRLTFYNAGSAMVVPTVLVGHLNGVAPSVYPGANFKEVVYFINVDKTAQSVTVDALKAKSFTLHPAHTAGADAVVKTSAYESATGKFTIPARTAAVFVVN